MEFYKNEICDHNELMKWVVCYHNERKQWNKSGKKKANGGTRTHNLWIRSPMRYPIAPRKLYCYPILQSFQFVSNSPFFIFHHFDFFQNVIVFELFVLVYLYSIWYWFYLIESFFMYSLGEILSWKYFYVI